MTKPLPSTDADGEVRELTGNDFKQIRSAGEVLTELFGTEQAAEMLKPKGGRPRKDSPKVFTGIRLDADVLDAFRSTGKGRQTRMNDALKEWLKDLRGLDLTTPFRISAGN